MTPQQAVVYARARLAPCIVSHDSSHIESWEPILFTLTRLTKRYLRGRLTEIEGKLDGYVVFKSCLAVTYHFNGQYALHVCRAPTPPGLELWLYTEKCM